MSLKLLCGYVIKAAMWLKSLKSTTNLGFTLTLTWITNDPKLPGDYVIVAKVQCSLFFTDPELNTPTAY